MNLFSGNLSDENKDKLSELDGYLQCINNMDDHEKIHFINEVKKKLHELSPLKGEPVDCVLWVDSERVFANDYNPNSVAAPEME